MAKEIPVPPTWSPEQTLNILEPSQLSPTKPKSTQKPEKTNGESSQAGRGDSLFPSIPEDGIDQVRLKGHPIDTALCWENVAAVSRTLGAERRPGGRMEARHPTLHTTPYPWQLAIPHSLPPACREA